MSQKSMTQLAERLKNTDGFIKIHSKDIAKFLEQFHEANPYMKIEAKEEAGEHYILIVISGG